MSDRSGKSPESSSPTHHLSTSPKLPNPLTSPARTLSSSDTTTTSEHSTKKSPFNLLDSILQRSVTKPLTINTSSQYQDLSQSKKLSTPTSSNALPEQARCLHSYNAIKEDEICVQKGEFVQIVAANQDNRWFVHRDATRTSPAAEGWIPGHVLGIKNSNSTLHRTLTPSPPPSSLSSNSLHRLTSTTTTTINTTTTTNTSSTTHHPTISYESTLPPKPQTSTCDKV